MSSKKQPLFWQRLKQLFSTSNNTLVDDVTPQHKTTTPTQTVSPSSSASLCLASFEKFKRRLRSHHHKLSPQQQESSHQSTAQGPDTDTNTDTKHADNASRDTNDEKPAATEHPITDTVLTYLIDNDLSYHYHKPKQNSAEQDSRDSVETLPETLPETSFEGSLSHSKKNTDDDTSAPKPSQRHNVQHISLSMRYDHDQLAANQSSTQSKHNLHDQLPNPDGMQWGCVIRIHEHTQLIAMYGILPYHLPQSHMQAGMTLATQLNYDMMLGNIEIDIRDGEIRFKNALDLEPIMRTNNGKLPHDVIDFLFKGIIAMTSAFSPLFNDLVVSDPNQYELDSLLEQINKAQKKQTYYMLSDTIH